MGFRCLRKRKHSIIGGVIGVEQNIIPVTKEVRCALIVIQDSQRL